MEGRKIDIKEVVSGDAAHNNISVAFDDLWGTAHGYVVSTHQIAQDPADSSMFCVVLRWHMLDLLAGALNVIEEGKA